VGRNRCSDALPGGGRRARPLGGVVCRSVFEFPRILEEEHGGGKGRAARRNRLSNRHLRGDRRWRNVALWGPRRSAPWVNLGFASGDRQRYVSVSGRATLVRDPARAKELWKPILKAWFPGGLEDPNLALLRVSIEEAESWDDTANRMVSFLRMVHSAVTGAEYEAEHGRLKA